MAESNEGWWAGRHEEWMTIGPVPTKEDAIVDARADDLGEHGFWIMRAATKTIAFDVKRLIDDQYFEDEDSFSYENGSEPERRGNHEEADAELQAFLNDWLTEHSDTFVQPTIFAWTDDREFVPADQEDEK